MVQRGFNVEKRKKCGFLIEHENSNRVIASAVGLVVEDPSFPFYATGRGPGSNPGRRIALLYSFCCSGGIQKPLRLYECDLLGFTALYQPQRQNLAACCFLKMLFLLLVSSLVI